MRVLQFVRPHTQESRPIKQSTNLFLKKKKKKTKKKKNKNKSKKLQTVMDLEVVKLIWENCKFFRVFGCLIIKKL